MTQLMVLKKTGHKRTTSRRQRQPSSGVSTTSRPPIRGCRQDISWSPGPGQATSPSSSSSFLPGSPGPDQARLPGYQAVVFFFLLARFTRSRTPVFLLLPGPGHQSSCFFLLRRPSPTDSGVNGCPRLYTPISQ